jgi:hypothetical protein
MGAQFISAPDLQRNAGTTAPAQSGINGARSRGSRTQCVVDTGDSSRFAFPHESTGPKGWGDAATTEFHGQ